MPPSLRPTKSQEKRGVAAKMAAARSIGFQPAGVRRVKPQNAKATTGTPKREAVPSETAGTPVTSSQLLQHLQYSDNQQRREEPRFRSGSPMSTTSDKSVSSRAQSPSKAAKAKSPTPMSDVVYGRLSQQSSRAGTPQPLGSPSPGPPRAPQGTSVNRLGSGRSNSTQAVSKLVVQGDGWNRLSSPGPNGKGQAPMSPERQGSV